MSGPKPNRFVSELARVCRAHVLADKWLVAPTVSVARQWIETLVRNSAADCVVNIHPTSFRRVWLDLARPSMESRGLTTLPHGAAELLISRIWREGRDDYLDGLSRSGWLLRLFVNTVKELRQAKVGGAAVTADLFEDPRKGRCMMWMLGEYERELKQRSWVDEPEQEALAVESLRSSPWPRTRLLIIPKGLCGGAISRGLVDLLPSSSVVVLDEDEAIDRSCLIEICGARREINEVRGALRAIIREDRAFDEVEVLYTTYEPYVRLVYETVIARVVSEPALPQVPVTFAEGLPVSSSRVGGSFMAWMDEQDQESPETSAADLFTAALRYLESYEEGEGDFEQSARTTLLNEIESRTALLSIDPAFEGFEWLRALTRRARTMRTSPRPGKLHVAPLRLGGHSGRPLSIILGLDDGRMPGSVRPNPLLLEEERSRLWAGTGAHQSNPRMERVLHLRSLLARLRGKTILSYPKWSSVEDRPRAPASELVRILEELRHDGVKRRPVEIAESLVTCWPSNADSIMDEADWWLTTDRSAPSTQEAFARRYPLLAAGFRCAHERLASYPTAWDGFVGAAEPCDPTKDDGMILTPSAVEQFDRCPLAFLFERILRVGDHPSNDTSSTTWLRSAQRVRLLFEVFRDLSVRSASRGEAPRPLSQDELFRVIDERVAVWRRDNPPSPDCDLNMEYQELQRVALMLLEEERHYGQELVSSFFDVTIGGDATGTGSPLDSPNPVTITLPGGSRIRVRGRIDRLDEAVCPHQRWAMCLYDARSPLSASLSESSHGGHNVRLVTAWAAIESILKSHRGQSEEVAQAGWFFANPQGLGLRMLFARAHLERGLHEVEDLIATMKTGDFTARGDPSRVCPSCSFERVCRPTDETVERARHKREGEAVRGAKDSGAT